MLSQRDHIHIPLHHHNALDPTRMFARLPEPIEFSGFLKDRGFGGVQVLGLIVTQHPAAKGDHPAALVLYGEHDSLAKTIIGAALVVFHQHARTHEQILRSLIFPVGLHQVVPARRRKADAKIPGDLASQTPAFEVVHDLVAFAVLP